MLRVGTRVDDTRDDDVDTAGTTLGASRASGVAGALRRLGPGPAVLLTAVAVPLVAVAARGSHETGAGLSATQVVALVVGLVLALAPTLAALVAVAEDGGPEASGETRVRRPTLVLLLVASALAVVGSTALIDGPGTVSLDGRALPPLVLLAVLLVATPVVVLGIVLTLHRAQVGTSSGPIGFAEAAAVATAVLAAVPLLPRIELSPALPAGAIALVVVLLLRDQGRYRRAEERRALAGSTWRRSVAVGGPLLVAVMTVAVAVTDLAVLVGLAAVCGALAFRRAELEPEHDRRVSSTTTALVVALAAVAVRVASGLWAADLVGRTAIDARIPAAGSSPASVLGVDSVSSATTSSSAAWPLAAQVTAAVLAAAALGILLWCLVRSSRPAATGTDGRAPAAAHPRQAVESVASPAPRTTPRLTTRVDLLAPALLAVAGLVLSVAGGSTGIPMSARVLPVTAAAVATGERLARLRERGWLDAIVVAGGLVLTVTTLVVAATGALDLSTVSAERALLVLCLVATGWCATHHRPERAPYVRATHLRVVRGAPWVAAALLVAVVALTVGSVGGPAPPVLADPVSLPTSNATSAPTTTPTTTPSDGGTASSTTGAGAVATLTAAPVDATSVMVTVTSTGSSADAGSLELQTEVGGTQLSYPVFLLPDGATHTQVVDLPPSGRFVVRLTQPDRSDLAAPLATVTIDR